MKIFSILIGKLVYKVMKLFKYNSSVYPGYITRKIYPNILNGIKYPKLNIMVTGSSGKGSTVKIIKKMLEENGYKVTCNNGSNLLNAFVTTIIKDCTINGELKTDALVFEIDERFLKEITKYIKPEYLIINNITRDQPPRQENFDAVFEEIKKGILSSTHIIVNGDDPITKKFSLFHKGDITYFGIDKNSMSFDKMINYTKDCLYCPKCGSKLNFDYYHYGSVGKYNCTNCDFERGKIDYSITNINKKDMTITINKKDKIKIDNYILFNLYNICSTYALGSLIGIENKNIINSLNDISMENKIFEEFIVDNRKYVSLNCKAENNATYNLSLIYTMLDNETKTIVLGLREISRRYNHFDLSWLYDISFELLNDKSIDKIVCVGPYRYDFAARLKLAGINKDKIIILSNFDNFKETINNETKGTVYGILNFDYVKPFIDSIKEVK